MMLDLLPDNTTDIARYQLAASVILASASAAVAVLALIVASLSFWMTKINTLGSKPILIVATYDTYFEDDERIRSDILVIHAELWNRRKYPLSVHHYECDFEEPICDQSVGDDLYHPEDGVGYVTPSFASFRIRHHVDAANKLDLKIELPLLKSPSWLKGAFSVTVFAFDPVKKKKITLTARYPFTTPDTRRERFQKCWTAIRTFVKGPKQPWMLELLPSP